MSATTCPFCKAFVNFEELQANESLPPVLGMSNGSHTRISLQQCSNNNCRMWVVMVIDCSQIIRTWPEGVGAKSFADVPEHIGAAADEAYRCHSIRAYRASTMLARSVIEATAKATGIVDGKLFAKIEEMYAKGLIREFVRDGAHDVRHLGNDMAHGDFVDPVEEEDAELALSLMDEVLEEIFQAPARVRTAREPTARQGRSEPVVQLAAALQAAIRQGGI